MLIDFRFHTNTHVWLTRCTTFSDIFRCSNAPLSAQQTHTFKWFGFLLVYFPHHSRCSCMFGYSFRWKSNWIRQSRCILCWTKWAFENARILLLRIKKKKKKESDSIKWYIKRTQLLDRRDTCMKTLPHQFNLGGDAAAAAVAANDDDDAYTAFTDINENKLVLRLQWINVANVTIDRTENKKKNSRKSPLKNRQQKQWKHTLMIVE